MLILISLASAGTWPVCSVTSTTATTNGGWSLVDVRESDGGEDAHRGTWFSEASFSQTYGGTKEDNACESEDGMGGALMRWTSELLSVSALPGQGKPSAACEVRVAARGQADASGRAEVSQLSMGALARGDALSEASAENTGAISVDSGGGGRFSSEWAWRVGGSPTAEMQGMITVGTQAAYSGATLDIPGWAQIDAWDGEVEGWVRQGAEWVHVQGTAPMDISFGAIVPSRGEVCSTGLATAGSQSVDGGGGIGASSIRFTMEPVRSSRAVDDRPEGGPEFAPCSCD